MDDFPICCSLVTNCPFVIGPFVDISCNRRIDFQWAANCRYEELRLLIDWPLMGLSSCLHVGPALAADIFRYAGCIVALIITIGLIAQVVLGKKMKIVIV